MKRFACLFIITVLCFSSAAYALGGVNDIDAQLFMTAKYCVSLIGMGNFERAANILGFVNEEELQTMVSVTGVKLDDTIQTKVSVAYTQDNIWKIAVPMHEPKDENVVTMVFISENGSEISDCGMMMWQQVVEEYQNSDYVIWNEEYVSEAPTIIR